MSDTVKLHVTDRQGTTHEIEADVGFTLKDVIMRSIPMDHFGDCGGCCACATCHVYVDEAYADKLNTKDDDEADMLDMSSDNRENSRLGCQVQVTADMDGMKLIVAQDI